jgi:protein O-GlcNAc transferase
VDAGQLATESLRRGDLLAARNHCERWLADSPENANAIHTLGLIESSEGNLESAISLFREALRLQPRDALCLGDLGIVYSAAERWQEAVEAFAESLALEPGNPHYAELYACALLECKRFDDALGAYQIARELGADETAVLRGMGRTLAALGREDEALQAFATAIQLDPEDSFAFECLADLRGRFKHDDQAVSCCERAVELDPESPSALTRLAVAYSNVGELDRSIWTFRNVLRLHPDFTTARTLLLQALLHHPATPPREILEEHRQWAEFQSLTREGFVAFDNSRVSDRRLRIGYMSAEFYFNPSLFFLAPILGNHDPESFETFFYHTRPEHDEWTARFQSMTSNWRDVHGLTDEQVADLVQQDRIDILVDVSGHFPYGRLGVFMLRAAPVQVEYLNYQATSGLADMDYFLTDEWTDPAGLTEEHYTEQLCRLPSGYLAYLPPEDAPAVSPLPALRNGYLTFGLFQRPSKTNDGVWDAVAQSLLHVPRSRLLVHYVTRDFDNPNSRVRRSIREALASRGVDEQRLEFKGALGMSEHLACVAHADIALDTFPYNGQTTTCECLWMGLPVITLTGNSHVSRVTHAILHRVGLGDWATSSIQEYSEIATRVELNELAELRAGMRERLADSSLLDGGRVTREIEQAYRSMWRTWCSSPQRNRPRIAGAGR